MLKLYSFYRSSCACRVRISLNLKGIDYEYKAVNIFKGEQFSPGTGSNFGTVTLLGLPGQLISVICLGYVIFLNCRFLEAQSSRLCADAGGCRDNAFRLVCILMYLEEKYPQHPLLPKDLNKRAINYQAANIVCSSIQPFQNLAVLNYIDEKLSSGESGHWALSHINKGFAALEKLLVKYAGKYATGDEVFLADLFLAPQIHGSITRFNIDMTGYPLLSRVYKAYEELPAFQDAMPEKQPDAPKDIRE